MVLYLQIVGGLDMNNENETVVIPETSSKKKAKTKKGLITAETVETFSDAQIDREINRLTKRLDNLSERYEKHYAVPASQQKYDPNPKTVLPIIGASAVGLFAIATLVTFLVAGLPLVVGGLGTHGIVGGVGLVTALGAYGITALALRHNKNAKQKQSASWESKMTTQKESLANLQFEKQKRLFAKNSEQEQSIQDIEEQPAPEFSTFNPSRFRAVNPKKNKPSAKSAQVAEQEQTDSIYVVMSKKDNSENSLVTCIVDDTKQETLTEKALGDNGNLVDVGSYKYDSNATKGKKDKYTIVEHILQKRASALSKGEYSIAITNGSEKRYMGLDINDSQDQVSYLDVKTSIDSVVQSYKDICKGKEAEETL